MREIAAERVTEVVERLCITACTKLPEDWWEQMDQALAREESEVGKEILQLLCKNAEAAREAGVPICQDTGMAVVFLELGQEAVVVGGSLTEAVTEGVRRGYVGGYLRKSVVDDPLIRKNTGDNTPPIIHTEVVPGDKIKITVAPKGIGSENMSALKMLKPADGAQGVVDFVVEVVDRAGANPCPPIVVGVGIGGMMEKAALLAKKALLRPFGERSPRPHLADLEERILEKVNRLGIGPQGLGGRVTALEVRVEAYPTHIGGLPVAVNLQCHAARHAEETI